MAAGGIFMSKNESGTGLVPELRLNGITSRRQRLIVEMSLDTIFEGQASPFYGMGNTKNSPSPSPGNGGQCAWRHPDGGRCSERAMLELDHLKMWCRGGKHSEENLTLRCRRHNQAGAEQKLGTGFMTQARSRLASPVI